MPLTVVALVIGAVSVYLPDRKRRRLVLLPAVRRASDANLEGLAAEIAT